MDSCVLSRFFGSIMAFRLQGIRQGIIRRMAPSSVPSIRLVILDLNGTLIRENTWLNLNIAMGMTPEEDRLLLDRYNRGEFTYAQAQSALLSQYRRHGRATRQRITSEVCRYTFLDGVPETVSYLRATYRVAIVTGAMDIVACDVARTLGIDQVYAMNTFQFDADGQLTRIALAGRRDDTFKRNTVRSLCRRLGIRPSQCVAVGDDESDRKLFELVRGITFRGSPISDVAWREVDTFSDLTKIL